MKKIRMNVELDPEYEKTFLEFCETLDRANELLLRLRYQAKEILIPVGSGNEDAEGQASSDM